MYRPAQKIVAIAPHQCASPRFRLSTMAGTEMTASATEQHDTNMHCLSTMAGTEMTASATEQHDTDMHCALDVQSEVSANVLATPVTKMRMEIHVEFNNGMWWAMPHWLSDPILCTWTSGYQIVSFVWDWKGTRTGSYQPNGVATPYSRYTIDFSLMQQRNSDNGRTRNIKVLCVLR